MVVVGLTAVAAHLFVPESPVRTPGRIDWRATLLLSGWLVALLLPISKGAAWGWTSAGCSACWRSPWCCWSAGWSPRCAPPTR